MIINKEEFNASKRKYLKTMEEDIFIYPTDSIYGIGCDATNEKLVQKIRDLKQNMPDAEELEKIKEQDAEMSKEEEPKEEEKKEGSISTKLYALRVTANREDQVMSFLSSNIVRKKLEVYAVIRPHGMRGYIFVEAKDRADAEQAAYGIPYSRGILPGEVPYTEIEHMLEQAKKDVDIRKNDIAEIISGPFKRENCKITRVDKAKEEVVVELLEAAVPIPITLKLDAIKVIRREEE